MVALLVQLGPCPCQARVCHRYNSLAFKNALLLLGLNYLNIASLNEKQR